MPLPDNLDYPDGFDANLPAQSVPPDPPEALQGLAAIQHRLAYPTIEHRVAALLEALKYGEAGVDLIVRSLQDPALQVQEMAYSLLRPSQRLEVRQALCDYNPWPLFECLQTFQASPHAINSVALTIPPQLYPWHAISPIPLTWEDQLLISGSGDQTVQYWNLQTGQLLRVLRGHDDWVRTVLASADGQHLVTAGARWDNTIKLWDLTTGDLLRSFVGEQDTIFCPLALSPDSQTLVSGRQDGSIRLWDLQRGQALRTLTGRAAPITALAIAPDGRILVTGSQESITVWNLRTGCPLRHLEGHPYRITSLLISPDGRMLISAGMDNCIKIWALRTGQEIYTIAEHQDAVLALALSPDGQTLISGGEDKTLRVWDLRTGRELCALVGHHGEIRSIAVSLDGQRIVSGSGDGSIRIWGMPALSA